MVKRQFELPVRKVMKASKSLWVYSKDDFLICKCFGHQRADYIVQAINSHEKQELHIESLKAICEAYIPADLLDKANDELILLCEKTIEEIGRKLLAKQALKEVENQND